MCTLIGGRSWSGNGIHTSADLLRVRSLSTLQMHACKPFICSQDKLSKKAPFSQYEQLGAQVVWGSPSDPACIPAGAFDIVYDNNGKDLEACKPLIDHFKVCCWRVGLPVCAYPPACL